MKFHVGDKVELINNGGMAAPLGAIAIVSGKTTGVFGSCIKVKWEGNVNYQMDGHYSSNNFKVLPRKNQQLLFGFMRK